MSRDKSDLERGLESFGRALEGVTGRLFGPKAIGKEVLPEQVAISPEADAAIEKVGDDLGRLLNAAGEALKEHPLDPAEAVKAARDHTGDPVTPEEGWSPLAAGLVNLGGGLAKVAEGVLDVVAPRKPKPSADDPGDAPTDAASAEDVTPDTAEEPPRAP
jgi:hypothetical protein